MKKFTPNWILFCVLVMSSPVVQISYAQDQTALSGKTFSPHLYLGGKLGTAFLGGNIQKTWGIGFGGAAVAGYQLASDIAVEGEFNIYLERPKPAENEFVDPWSGEKIEFLETTVYFGLLMSLKYSFMPDLVPGLAPYATIGGGFQILMWDLSDEAMAFSYSSVEQTDGVYATALSASIGADYYITPQLAITANLRYVHHIWSDELIESKDEADFTGNAIIPTIGGVIHF